MSTTAHAGTAVSISPNKLTRHHAILYYTLLIGQVGRQREQVQHCVSHNSPATTTCVPSRACGGGHALSASLSSHRTTDDDDFIIKQNHSIKKATKEESPPLTSLRGDPPSAVVGIDKSQNGSKLNTYSQQTRTEYVATWYVFVVWP
jgi:hypothetical protein